MIDPIVGRRTFGCFADLGSAIDNPHDAEQIWLLKFFWNPMTRMMREGH